MNKKNEIVKKINGTKINSFVSEFNKIGRSMVKMANIAYEICGDDKKLFKAFSKTIEEKIGMTRVTAYKLLKAGEVIHHRKELENSQYSKLAEIGKLKDLEENIEVFEAETGDLVKYTEDKTRDEIITDVKNFNNYGTINPIEAEESEETEETEESACGEVETVQSIMSEIRALANKVCDFPLEMEEIKKVKKIIEISASFIEK